jgi:hypothetical protein
MWTHGVHLIASSAFDMNLIPPTGTTTYTVCSSSSTCNGPTFTRPNLDSGLLTEGRITSKFNQIDALISPGVNNYNALYLQLQRRASQGLSLQVAYTFSKTLQSNGVDFFNQFDFHGTKGPSLQDQRHRLSAAAVYSPDASRLSNGAAKVLLSNWTVSTVMQFSSGRPYPALLTGAANGSNLNDSAFNEKLISAAGINGLGPSPTVGLNAFYGPWIQEVDLGIARSFHLTERQKIVFQAQAFNLFNHPNFFVQNASGIGTAQYDPSGSNCGDGATTVQTCLLMPDPGFKQILGSINELNPPRIFQFGFRYQF